MRNQLLCSTRLPSLITAIGSLPLFIFWLVTPTDIPVLIPQLYVYGILNFIAGINWYMGLTNNKPSAIAWSIFLALTPLTLFIGQHYLIVGDFALWVGLLCLLWLSLFYDFYCRHDYDLPYFFCFRRSGTIFLTIAIILILK